VCVVCTVLAVAKKIREVEDLAVKDKDYETVFSLSLSLACSLSRSLSLSLSLSRARALSGTSNICTILGCICQHLHLYINRSIYVFLYLSIYIFNIFNM
jgi:hypothetical protein